MLTKPKMDATYITNTEGYPAITGGAINAS